MKRLRLTGLTVGILAAAMIAVACDEPPVYVNSWLSAERLNYACGKFGGVKTIQPAEDDSGVPTIVTCQDGKVAALYTGHSVHRDYVWVEAR
ncbi:hypothetical protein GCM10012275_28670 [Longimycelium tulufanense]|uniref:Uncharacterized protein n=1 Tax=Longimycelium tulufanense TaxID=907463 RepID=A0A8J3C8R0_9PSEU|nr:hypothetical protein GCM10012275_28670 [Longimycelium tulufanense]